MATKSHNNVKLSEYFIKKTQKGEKVPYMTTISKDTGISVATISRYAKRKGFYNFGELRAAFNKNLDVVEKAQPIHTINKYWNSKDIKICASKSTEVIGLFLKQRLEFLDSTVEITNEETDWKKGSLTIFITLSGESRKFRETFEKAKGKKIVVSTQEIKDIDPSIKQVVLSKFEPSKRNVYDISNSITKIINWFNETINMFEIKRMNDQK